MGGTAQVKYVHHQEDSSHPEQRPPAGLIGEADIPLKLVSFEQVRTDGRLAPVYLPAGKSLMASLTTT